MLASYGAVIAIEADLGPILGLSARVRSPEHSISVNDIAVIVARAIQAAGKEREDKMLAAVQVEKIARMIFEGGVSKVMQPLTKLLYRMLSGTKGAGG